jgi:hypothetical protein
VEEEASAAQQSDCPGKDANIPDSPGSRAPERLATMSAAAEPALMLEAHAPHKAIHTWMDFLVHIATIVVGLLIAVGLEQSIEFFHHRHQRRELEVQMHDVFETNENLDARNAANLNTFRTYLADLQKALAAKRQGQSGPAAPDSDDPRSVVPLSIPGLAPYEAAKENGTVALLPPDRIRMYNRIESQGTFLLNTVSRFDNALAAVNSFNARFDQSANGLVLVEIGRVPDFAKLSPAELAELQALIGTLINATDLLTARMAVFSIECRLVLNGARDDSAFIDAIYSALKADSKLNKRLPN